MNYYKLYMRLKVCQLRLPFSCVMNIATKNGKIAKQLNYVLNGARMVHTLFLLSSLITGMQVSMKIRTF